MSAPLILALAMLLDAAMGEPRWLWSRLPHPAVLMGRAVGFLDKELNTDKTSILAGILALLLLMGGAALLGWGLSALGGVVQVIVVCILLAQRSLVQHVAAVADGLRVSLGDGRRAVSMIVSRDTAQMDQSATARSAIESAAENLSDGVIAPAFWFLVAGLPGLLIYKIVNTADSMIGYRTPQYERFGKAAALMDDAMNILPARLTSVLIALPTGVITSLRAISRDAKLHRSPNAGWPEAAMARAIGVALAGPRAYDGKMQDFPWVGGSGARIIGPKEIDASLRVLWQAWGMMLGLTILLALI
ncbi:adenosylcobinamide-phosphate synthase CbiB [Sulfitobacter donghicola]|uniref:Cobalamin biosynthesis protein CobD n=1 Tax=Sulfitobacter donghicola DSW-25 = KCTC 12864 = JCM 14565 TaxID=1300350 RepID=A0A073J010_9RHOB|nr:adenosylcobinamide-phosphate synthase CbiB [Sulfitobacter donghicola]KEJ90982.1 cobalamin biosynthesis protein CobD [Sulfitobacter donghicola DSW-25 = KCTC 12864 = JCM 14565]KIN68276.1 Cobalamin biosynthesis protein CobD [Sulfitobacter donghicola DSW-25 = KCTC 12864 = JCM 14565]